MAPRKTQPSPPTTPSDGPDVFEPRVWVIKKMAFKMLELIPRNVLVDVKLAQMHLNGLLLMLKEGQHPPLEHFDDFLEKCRRPLPQRVYTVVLEDQISKKEITVELSGSPDTMDDKAVHDWVAGLNILESQVQVFALKRAKDE